MAKVKHAVLVGGFAVAAALGQLVFASQADAKPCPSGTVPSKFEGVCVSGPSGGGVVPVLTPASEGSGVVNAPGQLPSVNGIPCTIEHYGTCLALSQQQ
ncbi:hypothetical protein [Mycobacterium sp. UM_WWY]